MTWMFSEENRTKYSNFVLRLRLYTIMSATFFFVMLFIVFPPEELFGCLELIFSNLFKVIFDVPMETIGVIYNVVKWHLLLLVVSIFVSVYLLVVLDLRFERKKTEKKVTKGVVLITPQEFSKPSEKEKGIGIPYRENRWLKASIQRLRDKRDSLVTQALLGDGADEDSYGFEHPKRHPMIHIKKSLEAEHMLLVGDPGGGKSQLIHHILKQIRERGDKKVVIYDPALEFYKAHGCEDDILFYPLAEDCPYWDITAEIEFGADATDIAKSFLPGKREGSNDFFDKGSVRLFSFLLKELKKQKASISTLLDWISNSDTVDKLVEGTELVQLIERNAEAQRAGVFASIGMVADGLKLLPPRDGRRELSITKWMRNDEQQWIFLGSNPRVRDALRPIISAFIDIALGRMMDSNHYNPKVEKWLFGDEWHTLQMLPKLRDSITEIRKYGGRLVLGMQGESQIEALYGRYSSTLLSAPSTKIFFRNKDERNASWCAGAIGRPTTERAVESFTASTGGGRDSVNIGTEVKSDYIVTPNEIQTLKKMEFFMLHEARAMRLNLPFCELPKQNDINIHAFEEPVSNVSNQPKQSTKEPPQEETQSISSENVNDNFNQVK